jgi:hypothetical protein
VKGNLINNVFPSALSAGVSRTGNCIYISCFSRTKKGQAIKCHHLISEKKANALNVLWVLGESYDDSFLKSDPPQRREFGEFFCFVAFFGSFFPMNFPVHNFFLPYNLCRDNFSGEKFSGPKGNTRIHVHIPFLNGL